MTDYPTISFDDVQDERASNVILIYKENDFKATAEDRGDDWMLRDWELIDHDESKAWFDRCGFSISKTTIDKLNQQQFSARESNAEHRIDIALQHIQDIHDDFAPDHPPHDLFEALNELKSKLSAPHVLHTEIKLLIERGDKWQERFNELKRVALGIWYSKGCSCCEDTDNMKLFENEFGKLIDANRWSDGSDGFDLYEQAELVGVKEK